jgi:hypothetical protein
MISNEVKAEVLYNSKKKSMLAAYLLGGFLGNIGAHYFYLGRKEFGFIMIGNTILMVATTASGSEGVMVLGSLVYLLALGASFVHTYYVCNEVNKNLRDECAIMVEK